MVGRLARWLRLIGNDVEYLSNCSDKHLVRKALAEDRVLITSDTELYRYAVSKNAEAYLVKEKTESERLARIADRYGLDLKAEAERSRCPTCNSMIEAVDKRDVADKVPLSTFSIFDEFWRCTNPDCGKIYWRGGHWENIEKHLAKAQTILSKGVKR